MKVIPFQVPQTRKEAFRIQIDRLPHFYDKLHQHHEVQIMWIEMGEGTLIAGNYVGRFTHDELYIIGSNQPHVFKSDDHTEHSDNSIHASSLSILFDEKYLGEQFWQLDELLAANDLLKQAKQGIKVTGDTKQKVVSLIKEIVKQNGLEKLISYFNILKQLVETKEISLLSVAAPEDFNQSEGKRMNEILQLTFKESHRKIYIDEVATVANLSTEAFCRYFKTRTGKTYTNFLNEVRVSNACKLLFNKDLSIQDVCYRTGFSNLSNFNRIFKRVTGKTPSRYLN